MHLCELYQWSPADAVWVDEDVGTLFWREYAKQCGQPPLWVYPPIPSIYSQPYVTIKLVLATNEC